MADADNERWDEDPGWRLDWRAMVPFVQLAYFRRSSGDARTLLRSAYVSFLIYLVLIISVTPGLVPFAGGSSVLLWVIGLGVVAVTLFLLAPRIERPMRCSSDSELVAGFRTRGFLRLAFAYSISLYAFCGTFVVNSSWVFFAGLLFSIPSVVRAAPTRAAVAREQDELTRCGCDRSLVAALRNTR